jgi:hypothetical protein
VEIEHDVDEGFRMGVYLCLGQQIHNLRHCDAINITEIKTFKAIQEHYAQNGKIFVFMGEGQHKIKRKAEQAACMSAIDFIKMNNDITISSNMVITETDTSSDSDN